MFKYSITKKQVYALVLESKKITYKPRQKNYSVKKIISKKEFLYTYDSSLEKIIRTNFHLNSDKRQIGYVFQDCALFPHLTIIENIFFSIKKNDIEDKPQWTFFPWTFFPIISTNSQHLITRNINPVKSQFPSSIDTTNNTIKKKILLQFSVSLHNNNPFYNFNQAYHYMVLFKQNMLIKDGKSLLIEKSRGKILLRISPKYLEESENNSIKFISKSIIIKVKIDIREKIKKYVLHVHCGFKYFSRCFVLLFISSFKIFSLFILFVYLINIFFFNISC